MADVNIKVSIISSGAQASIKALTNETQKLENGFRDVNVKIKSSTSALEIFKGVVAGQAFINGIRTITTGLINFARGAVQAASDAEETASKFKVVFQDVGDEAEAAAKKLTTSFGLSRDEAKNLLGATGDLLTGFGFTGKSALSLSSQVQELAVDLASFTNFSGGAKGASEALTKALLGERESVKALGISILEEDVKRQVAINTAKGLTFATERQAKAQATLDIALRQSKNALGDFARTSGGFANQQRILTAAVGDITAAIGEKFLPTLTKLTGNFISFIKTNEDLVVAFATDAATKFANAITFLGEAAVNTIKLLSQLNKFVSENGLAIKAGLATIAAGFTILAISTGQFAFALNAALAPFTLASAAIVTLGVLVAGLVKFINDAKDAFDVFAKLILTGLLPMFDKTISVVGALAGIFNEDLGRSILGVRSEIKKFIEDIRKGDSAVQGINKALNDNVSANESIKTALQEARDIRAAFAQDEIDANKKKSEQLVEDEKLKDARLKALADAKKARDDEVKIQESDLDKVKTDENLIIIEENLGREEAIRFAARQRELEEQGLHDLALLELQKKLIQAKNKGIIEADAKAKVAAKAQLDLDIATVNAKVSIAQNAATLINTIAGKQTKLAFIIQKASAIGSLFVQDALARGQANTVALGVAAAAGPAGPQVYASTLATLNGLITANTALAGGIIAAQTIQGFASGGIVPGNSLTGDRVPAALNSGEVVLNRSQQSELLGIANGNQSSAGGGSGQVIEIYTNVNLDGEVVARAVSRQVADGFKLGEVV